MSGVMNREEVVAAMMLAGITSGWLGNSDGDWEYPESARVVDAFDFAEMFWKEADKRRKAKDGGMSSDEDAQ